MEENAADAAQRQDWEKVQRLVERGDDVNEIARKYVWPWCRGTALHYAAFCGKAEMCELLIERGANVSAADKKGDQPLHRAAAGNSVAVCQLLLDHGGGHHVNAVNKHGVAPLHTAARGWRECPELCEILLKREAKINAVDNYGQQPLHLACKKGYAETGCLLLSYGADFRAADLAGNTPLLLISKQITGSRNGVDAMGNHALHIASRYGMSTAVQLLVDLGAETNVMNKHGQTPLHMAANRKKDCPELCEILLEHAAKIDAVNDDGNQPLHLACKRGNINTGNLLLSHGADRRAVNNREQCPLLLISDHYERGVNNEGNLALHIASRHVMSAAVQFLVDLGADTNAMNRRGQTPLHAAAGGKKDCPKLCDILLEREAKINAMDECRQQPLHLACEKGYAEAACLLLSHGAEIRAVDLDGHTPLLLISKHITDSQRGFDNKDNHALHIASRDGMSTAVQLLIDLGADTNALNKHGQTPLHLAADTEKDCPALCEILLKYAAKIDAVDEDGSQPLHLACKRAHIHTGNLLLCQTVNINAMNKHGKTPLHMAADAEKDCPELCKILLKRGAKINAVDGNGNQPLHLACKQGHTNTGRLLLSHGADCSTMSKHGQSPLHAAAGGQEDCPELCEILLQHDAKIDTIDEDGSQPLHLACKRSHTNTVNLFLSHGAGTNLVNKHGQTWTNTTTHGS